MFLSGETRPSLLRARPLSFMGGEFALRFPDPELVRSLPVHRAYPPRGRRLPAGRSGQTSAFVRPFLIDRYRSSNPDYYGRRGGEGRGNG